MSECAKCAELTRALSDGAGRWIDVGERLPEDEQKVLAYWHSKDCAESVTYHASDSEVDGREAWMNAFGGETDPPDCWRPFEPPHK